MIAPPKGSNNAILLNASFIDTFDKYKISSKNISIIIGTIICCEKTVKTMIIIAEISFTGHLSYELCYLLMQYHLT